MPARNEEGCIGTTLDRFIAVLREDRIPFEIVVVDDGSTDTTASLLSDCAGSGKTGLENQLHGIFIAEDLPRRDESERL